MKIIYFTEFSDLQVDLIVIKKDNHKLTVLIFSVTLLLDSYIYRIVSTLIIISYFLIPNLIIPIFFIMCTMQFKYTLG